MRRSVGAIRLEHVAECIDGAAQGRGSSTRRAVGPERFDEPIGRDRPRSLGDEDLEQLPRLTRLPIALRDRMLIAYDLQRAEGANFNLGEHVFAYLGHNLQRSNPSLSVNKVCA